MLSLKKNYVSPKVKMDLSIPLYLKMRTGGVGHTPRLIHELPSKYSRFITVSDSTVRVPSG